MADRPYIYDAQELATWYRPNVNELREEDRDSYRRAEAALLGVVTGQFSLARAAKLHGLCRKRLKRMVAHAPGVNADGMANGFRVCVPYGIYQRTPATSGEALIPLSGGPGSMAQLLQALPAVRGLVERFRDPLPPGRASGAFSRLHERVCAELRRLDLCDHYPLNTPDRGRRALLDYLRRDRLTAVVPGTLELEPLAVQKLEDAFRGRLFDRTEFDAHRIDVEGTLSVALPDGGVAERPITTLWLLAEVEVRSRAIVSWPLRVGRGYNNLDVANCLASGLRPWTPRELTIPDLAYAPGAGMPTGLEPALASRRSRSIALDNALAHSALELESSMCRSRGGVIIFGRAHEPRSRPIVEQLFSRLERGALRRIPGGFEPAKAHSESKRRISKVSGSEHYFNLGAFEELLDVIIANYNATPHPALGSLSPLQFLRSQPCSAFAFCPDGAEQDAADLCTVLVPLVVHGNKSQGVVPHVNKYVKYRGPGLEGRWELIGKTVLARVNRSDLRTLTLMKSVTAPLCSVRAAAPWARTAHDETTRALIMQWIKNRSGFSVFGADCAVAAYVSFLKNRMQTSQLAADQLARMDAVAQPASRHAVEPDYYGTVITMATDGWISLDE
ncbi:MULTISPECIES: hypothetical protein [Stenotrophomonas]|nr:MULTISPECIES: hypothetical protein [Stenotrophomonas]EMB2829552.1 hypothetical protein [Stenotrophomonas maltophilia]MBH1450833.1 hypothetical protein [Stenotrophomonas maltophilia]MBH1728270.1 hypothetical protein [Stenotrophomonas maltophilia]MBK5591166.1 hypothetical protein [Stenotrophomonas maltophilia]MBN5040239.1 hypothetical protein [Stenotrophomonas maltophilia]